MNRKTVNVERKLRKSSSRYRTEWQHRKERERDTSLERHSMPELPCKPKAQHTHTTHTHTHTHTHTPHTHTHHWGSSVDGVCNRAGEESICDTYGTEQTSQRLDQEKLRVQHQEKARATVVCVCVCVCMHDTCVCICYIWETEVFKIDIFDLYLNGD